MKKFFQIPLRDKLVIVAIPLCATAVVEGFRLPFITSIFVYFGLPTVYLFWRDPKIIKKVLLFSLIVWWPLMIVWDYLAYVDNTWFVPSAMRFIRNSLPYQDIFWGLLYIMFGLSVYEYFFNEKRSKKVFPRRFYFLACFFYGGLALFLLLYFLSPQYLVLPYFFLWMGLVFAVVPLILFLLKYPGFLVRYIALGVYFFLVFGLMEHAALTGGHWLYPGQHYIGVMNFFGYRLPWDEIIFLWILSVPALASWYEYFADDCG